MADLAVLVERLKTIFPGRADSEYEGWVGEAAGQHNYTIETIPTTAETAIVLFAKCVGIEAKALETAENVAVNIGGKISINKTSASGNYQQLFDKAYKQYRQAAQRAGLAVAGGRITFGSLTRSDGR